MINNLCAFSSRKFVGGPYRYLIKIHFIEAFKINRASGNFLS